MLVLPQAAKNTGIWRHALTKPLERFFTSVWATTGQPFLAIFQALLAGERGRRKG